MSPDNAHVRQLSWLNWCHLGASYLSLLITLVVSPESGLQWELTMLLCVSL